MKSKKGQLGTIQALIVPLAAVAILIVIGFLIMAEVKDQAKTVEGGLNRTENTLYTNCSLTTGTNCSYAVNATIALQSAMDDIPGWLPIIVVTVIGAALIGIIGMFAKRR